ncbi:MAG: hypothetical protein NTV86_15530 [Planctomycetota bacterium]|nr:hypothetical protein [Planctomycetota bacterium]
MNRPLPGTIAIEGREFLYVEYQDAAQFRKCFFHIPCDPLPREGGIINEEVTVTLAQEIQLHGVSYKGDIEGWRRCLLGWCRKSGLIWGKVVGDSIALSNGETKWLRDCKIEIR